MYIVGFFLSTYKCSKKTMVFHLQHMLLFAMATVFNNAVGIKTNLVRPYISHRYCFPFHPGGNRSSQFHVVFQKSSFSLCSYVCNGLPRQAHLPKVKYSLSAVYEQAIRQNISLCQGVLVLGDHYVHTNRENELLDTVFKAKAENKQNSAALKVHSHVPLKLRQTICV